MTVSTPYITWFPKSPRIDGQIHSITALTQPGTHLVAFRCSAMFICAMCIKGATRVRILINAGRAPGAQAIPEYIEPLSLKKIGKGTMSQHNI